MSDYEILDEVEYLEDDACLEKKMVLMHKDVPVMDVVFADDYIVSVGHVYNKDHLPIMDRMKDSKPKVGSFSTWWQGRGIPKHRVGINELFSNIPPEYRKSAILQSMNLGLSLSDQYWIRPEGSDVSWEDVNYFHNDFGHQLENVCMNEESIMVPEDVCLIGPSSSLGGNQKKAWKIMDGRRYMIKESRQPYYQEAVDEVIGSDVCEFLGIPHVDYQKMEYDGRLFSVCSVGITDSEDLITFYDLSNYLDITNNTGALDVCRKFLAEHDIQDNIDDLIVVDYVLRNTDRHLRNMCIVRDADTGEYTRMFPAFDFGNSLWYDVATEMIDNKPVVNQLTGRMFEDDLRKVKGISFREDKLLQIPLIVEKHLLDAGYKRDRVSIITDSISERIDTVDKYLGLGLASDKEEIYDTGLDY